MLSSSNVTCSGKTSQFQSKVGREFTYHYGCALGPEVLRQLSAFVG